jgi:hypothetical protein
MRYSIRSSFSRSGNTLIVAMGILMALVAMVILSSESAIKSHQSTTHVRGGIEAVGAVEFVLARREQQVLELASLGDPVEFTRWKAHFGSDNYGVDYIGNCEVRWKVEPSYTAPFNNPENPTEIEFIANPNPNPSWAPEPGSKQLANDNTFLFRIAAEARYTPSSPEQVLARAQGVRYAVINKEALFRYVIFYAQSGNKGDLEITHEDKVEIRGNVHTNGALYVGSGSLTNDYAAVSGPSEQTIIGPTKWRDLNLNGIDESAEDNLPVRVTAVDGIFRLSKQTMYGALNDFPMKSVPSGWAVASAYDDNPAHLYPRDGEIGITPAELSEVSKISAKKVNVINPYRVKDASGFVTTGAGFKHLNPSLSIASAQTFNWDADKNGVPLLGMDQDSHRRNDARDGWFAGKDGSEWKQYSIGSTAYDPARPQGFAGYLRSNETGGKVKKLPRELSGVEDAPLRPLERQQIMYSDADNNPSTDQHELAAPIFAVMNSGDNKSAAQSASDFGHVVEVPGKYLGLALGDGCLVRLTDGSGWEVKKVTASGLSAPIQMAKMGLAIVERPVPDTTIWPGAALIDPVPSTSADYLPFAYGKHWRASFLPFFAIDVSENISPGARSQAWRGIGFDAPLTDTDPLPVNLNGQLRRHSYSPGGALAVSAAGREGAPPYVEISQIGGIARTPQWYNDNWRFFHLKRPQWGGQSQPGVKVSYFKDASPKDETDPTALADSALIMATWGGESGDGNEGTRNYNSRALTGIPDLTPTPSLVMAVVAMPALSDIAATVGNDLSKQSHHSLRYEGFVVPQYDEVYTFTVRGGDGVRLWFDGNLATVPGSWKSQSATPYSYVTSGSLVKNTPYHFVIDYYQETGSQSVGLEWSSASQARQGIPSGTTSGLARGLYLPESFTGFNSAKFAYVQCKIEPTTLTGGTADQKVGLMLRDGSAGLSPMLSGRDSYIAMLYSPTRGFFTQRRLAPAIPVVSDRSSWFVGSGGRCKANGVPIFVSVDGMAPAAIPNNGTCDQVGSPMVYTDWHRPSTLKKVSTFNQPPVLIYNHDASKKMYDELARVTVTVNSQFCDLGDGNPFVAKYGYVGATNTARRSRSPWVDAYKFLRRDVRVALSSAGGVDFPDFSDARSLRVFSSSNTQATDIQEFSPAEAYHRDATQLDLIYKSWSAVVRSYGTSVSTELTVAENWVFSVTGQQIIKMNSKNWNGRNDWVLAPVPSILFNADTNLVYSAEPDLDWSSCPAPVPPAAPNMTQWDDNLERSFGLNMIYDKPYVVNDVNSYVSSYGQWSASLVPQYSPWESSWDDAGQFYIPAPTHSYRPDRWDETPFPAAGTLTIRSLVGAGARWRDDQPNPGGALPVLGPNIFLRIEQVAVNIFNFRYYSGPKTEAQLTDQDFQTLKDSGSQPVTANLAGWSPNLLVGPCVQSGSKVAATNVVFEDISIKINQDSSDKNSDGIVDHADWDAAGLGSGSPSAKYLASQYQVFFGIYDITEDFFDYLSSQPTAACASEEWFFSAREFWSQSRTWEDGTEKDASDPARTSYAGHDVITNRQLLGKTTVLTLNLGKDAVDMDGAAPGIQAEGIQGYLRYRSLSAAVQKPMSSLPVPVVAVDGQLSKLFNGLMYASRTNRYPWNPNRSLAFNSGSNPWSFDPLRPLPNSFSLSAPDMVSLSAASMPDANMLWRGVHKLQPYPLAVAPAFRPDDFHHGVRIRNASNIYWGYSANKFGESKTSIVCPNAVYVQGDVNTVKHLVTVRGLATSVDKNTPLAIFGDSINLESENFKPTDYQNAGLAVTGQGVVSGKGVLAAPAQSVAENTTYVTCFLTHNIPTSRARVREGQSAAFIDTMLFNEDWNPTLGRKTMTFNGSLVVMDSRRYTRAFLLDANKQYGRTVFGTTISDELSAALQASWTALLGGPQWTHSAPSVYRSPVRTYVFNDDLLTAEGTPPFTPFGVTSSGVGGWVRIVE